MNIEEFRDYCIIKKGVTEETPFGPDVLVMKVMNKMFALCGIDEFKYINLKCDPDEAVELREQYHAIQPGYHMNKRLWNSVYVNEDVADDKIYKMVDDSYDLIVESLAKKDKKALNQL